MQAPYSVDKAKNIDWPKHALAELAYAGLYAIDATPSGGLFPTIPLLYQDDSPTNPLHKWILSKFTTPTIYRGSVYVAAMSDELLVFGVDKDGDAIPDGIDNCRPLQTSINEMPTKTPSELGINPSSEMPAIRTRPPRSRSLRASMTTLSQRQLLQYSAFTKWQTNARVLLHPADGEWTLAHWLHRQ